MNLTNAPIPALSVLAIREYTAYFLRLLHRSELVRAIDSDTEIRAQKHDSIGKTSVNYAILTKNSITLRAKHEVLLARIVAMSKWLTEISLDLSICELNYRCDISRSQSILIDRDTGIKTSRSKTYRS